MIKFKFSAILASCLMWYGLLATTACTEQAENTIGQSDTPIQFSVNMATQAHSATTRVTTDAFEPQDQIGLFATLSPAKLSEERYIDNLLLETADGTQFTPEQVVYYPIGDVTLDFTAYYPYQTGGLSSGNSILSISVQTDQSIPGNLSKSDFLLARKEGISNGTETVELNFEHKLSRLKIALVPEEGEELASLLADDPRIVVTGIQTGAKYNLEDATISDLQTPEDITPAGKWTDNDTELIGKELIIIPQNLNSQKQSIILEWKGQIYTYLMPDVELQSGDQCEITIEVRKQENQILSGIAGSITDWSDEINEAGSNEEENDAIYTSSLSFASSNIYRVYYQGKAIAEICKEYLASDQLTSRAIVHYPILNETGEADLKNGTILQLLDVDDAICGGKLCWETDGNSFTYQEGEEKVVYKFYIGEDGSFLSGELMSTVNVNIVSHYLRDIRGKEVIEYPVVKIGKQYWMQEDLRTQYYRDGTALTQQTKLGEGAGYFCLEESDAYQYNGEAVLAGELTPSGWKIPTHEDWETLNEYIGGEASLLKTGTWASTSSKEPTEVAPATNLTGLSIYPQGMWGSEANVYYGQAVGYWCMEPSGEAISENIIVFKGESNEYSLSTSLMKEKEYYKALSIRCIKEIE